MSNIKFNLDAACKAIAEGQEIAAKATAGPWVYAQERFQPNIETPLDECGRCTVIVDGEHDHVYHEYATIHRREDADFIAHVRTAYPAALALLGAACDRIAELEAELKFWRPLTPEEAEKAMAEAKAMPMSEEQIQRIVAKALDPAERIDNFGTAAMAARIKSLEAERDRLEAECKDAAVAIEVATQMGVANSEGLVAVHGKLLAAVTKAKKRRDL